MNLLLDTHALLWWRSEPGALSNSAREALSDGSNTIHLSVVNAWEIQIKVALGKMSIDDTLENLIGSEIERNAFRVLHVLLPHVYALNTLAHHHKDPFDRLLIAQAIAEDLTVVTKDVAFEPYSVPTFW